MDAKQFVCIPKLQIMLVEEWKNGNDNAMFWNLQQKMLSAKS